MNIPATDQYYVQTRNAVSAAAGTANAAQYRIRIDGQQVTTVPIQRHRRLAELGGQLVAVVQHHGR